MSLPRKFGCDPSSKWLLDAFTSLRPHLSIQDQTVADAQVLLIEPRRDTGARTVIMACSKEPWFEKTTRIKTAASLSALFVLDVASHAAGEPTNVDAILLMDRDNEESRTGVIDIARRRTQLCSDGRMIIIASGISRSGGVFGMPETQNFFKHTSLKIQPYTDLVDLDADVDTAFRFSTTPILIVDPWSSEHRQWLTAREFLDQFS